ncbi:MAG: 1-acyl-sn-glycerol-3-phosphate acyltransferase, partial [Flavobacteriaceae bacterium]
AQKRLGQGLSICIFPEAGVPDENVILDSFKEGAFKMAIAHNIPVVPITFYDNKRRFPFSFYAGGPGILRVRIHQFFNTERLQEDQKSELKETVRNVILKELLKTSKTT